MFTVACVHIRLFIEDDVCCFDPRLEAYEEKLKDSELSSQKQLNESKNKLEAAVVSMPDVCISADTRTVLWDLY